MDFKKHFSSVTDPRVVGRISHLLSDIIGLSIIAVMAGCEGDDDIHSPSVSLIEDTDELRRVPEKGDTARGKSVTDGTGFLKVSKYLLKNNL